MTAILDFSAASEVCAAKKRFQLATVNCKLWTSDSALRGAHAMDDCLFCKIGEKKIPSKMVYEDPEIFAFEDIQPQAPTHVLICPRKHLVSLTDAKADDASMLGKLQLIAAQIAKDRKLTGGYRKVFNNGSGAGQSLLHLHLHLLGGREFRWPPG